MWVCIDWQLSVQAGIASRMWGGVWANRCWKALIRSYLSDEKWSGRWYRWPGCTRRNACQTVIGNLGRCLQNACVPFGYVTHATTSISCMQKSLLQQASCSNDSQSANKTCIYTEQSSPVLDERAISASFFLFSFWNQRVAWLPYHLLVNLLAIKAYNWNLFSGNIRRKKKKEKRETLKFTVFVCESAFWVLAPRLTAFLSTSWECCTSLACVSYIWETDLVHETESLNAVIRTWTGSAW